MNKKKMIVAGCLAMMLVTSMTVVAAEQDSGKVNISLLVKQGDVNVDGAVDENDCAILRKVLIGDAEAKYNSSAADTNRDDEPISPKDLVRLKLLIADKSSS